MCRFPLLPATPGELELPLSYLNLCAVALPCFFVRLVFAFAITSTPCFSFPCLSGYVTQGGSVVVVVVFVFVARI